MARETSGRQAAPDVELIDAHVHLYRSLELERKNVINAGRQADRDRWGNAESVRSFMDREGISAMVCLPNFPTRQLRASLESRLAADLPEDDRATALERIDAELRDRIRRQNEWMCSLPESDRRLVPTLAIHKIFSPEEMVSEVERGVAAGAWAVKMLPGLYHEFPDDTAFWPLYAACQEHSIPVVSDTGTLGCAETGVCFGEPTNFADVLEAFPRLTVVMAHFASAFWDERVELARQFPNLHFDISGSFDEEGLEVRDGRRALAFEDAVRVMRKVGIERFMFGSDGPRTLFAPALEQVLRLDLGIEEMGLLMAQNARRVYGI